MKEIFEKIKSTDAKKKSRFTVVILFVVLIILATITNIGFKGFDAVSWIINSLILAGIMVFGLFIGEGSGVDKFRDAINGQYQRNLKTYNETNIIVKPIVNMFSQWYLHILPSERLAKRMNFLLAEGVDFTKAEIIAKYASKEDFYSLCNEKSTKFIDPKTKEEHFVKKLSEDEKLPVEFLLSGKFKLTAPNYNFFLVANSMGTENTVMVEEGLVLQKGIKVNKGLNRGAKIGISLGVSLFWSTLTVYELMSGDNLQAWVTLVSRLTGFFTSMLAGYLGARVQVKLEARILLNKTRMLERFKNDYEQKNFDFIDPELEAKRIYEEEERKKEEAKKNVIDPARDKDKVEVIPLNTKSIPYSGNKK